MGSFSGNLINQQFHKVFEELERQNIIKGKSDIAKKLGTYNHVINSILKGERNITVDQLLLLFHIYGINANYIFGSSDQMFLEDTPGRPAGLPTRSMEERRAGGRNNIVLVPDRALAGYAVEHQNPAFLEHLPRFSVPGFEGELLAFEISGDSMVPTITDGDLVICQNLDRGEPLRDNQVYVVVTDVVVAKRIQTVRRGAEVTSLRLISDNAAVYKPYDVELPDIRQILRVKCRVTDYAIG